jgi:enoyl-CoA hydratase/carnithine racemase
VIRLACDAGVADIVLDGPLRRNALDTTAIDEFTRVLRSLAGRADVAAVLVRGAAGFFCSGLDLRRIDVADPPLGAWIGLHEALAALPVPVVAALAGGAINAGAALALAADLLVAGDSAYLQVNEAAMGLAAPVNAAWLALRHPPSVAAQLLLTCRRFRGPQLHRLGIAVDTVPDGRVVESARRLAGQVAAYPRGAGRAAKGALAGCGAEREQAFRRAVDRCLRTGSVA